MKQLGFLIDVSRCTGCKTCLIACKDGHSVPGGKNLRSVQEVAKGSWRQNEEGAWEQNVFAYYVSLSCNHCADPACVKVCPTKAHFKRQSDGLVLIDPQKCIGCGACAQACPYHVPVLNEKTKKMMKCDACAGRLANKQMPLCVQACPQRALQFGPIDELRKRYGENAEIEPLPISAQTKPSLVVLLPKRSSLR